MKFVMMLFWLVFIVVAPMLLQTSDVVSAAGTTDDYPIVSVDGAQITKRDLENAIDDRIRRSYDLGDEHLIKLTILKQLILETVADSLVTEKEISSRPALARNLEASRRDLLLKSYIDGQIVLKQPSDEDIKKYINDHPEYFSGRKMYHHSELIVDAKTEAVKKAVNERLNRLIELNEPTPDNMQLVIAWLEQNNIQYGYAKDWKPTEALPPTIKQTVIGLSQSGAKVHLENNGKAFRVVALYGAYPDPVNPLFAKNSVARALLDEARNKRVDAIVDDMLAHSKIMLYDPSFKDLKVPKFKGAVVQPSLPWARRLFISWNFALLVFAPLSLYVFFRQGPPPQQDYEMRTVFDVISFNVLFRVAVVVVAGAVLLLPTATALAAEFANTGKETYLSLAFFGVAFGLAAAFALSKIAFFKDLLSARWLSLSVLLLIQISSALMLE